MPKFAKRLDLVPVVVPINYKSGKVGEGIRYKSPDEAKAMVAAGKAKPAGAVPAGAIAGDMARHVSAYPGFKHVVMEPPALFSSPVHKPNLNKVDKQGCATSCRVGVDAMEVPPPPPTIPRMPNLTAPERAAEDSFAKAFEAPLVEYKGKKMSGAEALTLNYLEQIGASKEPKVFSTDEAKMLSTAWNYAGEGGKAATPEEKNAAKGIFNISVHATANAIAKRAFISRLDELQKLPEGDSQRTVLVTSGGCGSGKGFALGKAGAPEGLALMEKAGAVWDAAGEQNGIENAWILAACKERGLKPTFVYVDADPHITWNGIPPGPDGKGGRPGVIQRAVEKGRMVDARLFAESYTRGADNFKAFHDANKADPDVGFLIVDARTKTKPTKVDEFPEAALKDDVEELTTMALKQLHEHAGLEDVSSAIVHAGANGIRVWHNQEEGHGDTAPEKPKEKYGINPSKPVRLL